MAEILSKKELGSNTLYYIHYEDCKFRFFESSVNLIILLWLSQR